MTKRTPIAPTARLLKSHATFVSRAERGHWIAAVHSARVVYVEALELAARFKRSQRAHRAWAKKRARARR